MALLILFAVVILPIIIIGGVVAFGAHLVVGLLYVGFWVLLTLAVAS